jgi:SHS2 domain-containing protein
MATENQNEVVEAKQEEVVEATANPNADAPKKNAVAAEPTKLSNEAEDLGAAVVKPTDSNPDATKKSKKVSDAVNAKADDGDSAGKPDTDAGVTKVSHPGESMKAEEVEKSDEAVAEADANELSLDADVKALIGDENLTEEFKAKAATIFEAAVKTRIAEAKEKMETEYAEKLKEETESSKAALVEKVDSYLNYVVQEWMTQNEIAIERGIKGEIAEDFISGLKKLFEDHYINVPD